MGDHIFCCSYIYIGSFLVVVHRGNKSEVIHKFDHNDLLKAESSHVDRQMRTWYPIKTPLKAHNSGVNRLSVVLYYKDGPVEGETRHFTFIKAPPTESRVVHVDHRYFTEHGTHVDMLTALFCHPQAGCYSGHQRPPDGHVWFVHLRDQH